MATTSVSSKTGVLALVAAGITWGTSFLLIDNTVDQLGAPGFAISLFFRLFFAFLSSLVVFFIINKRILKTQLFYFKRKIVFLLTGLNVAGYLFQFLGAAIIESANLALLVNANIILVPILSYLWLHESMNYKKVGGMVIGGIGLLLVTTGGFFLAIVEGELVGNLISLGAGICWAFYIVISRKVMAKEDSEYKPLNLSLTTTLLSFLFLIPLLFIYNTSFSSAVILPTFPWWELIYLGIICTTVAYTLFYFGVKSVSATNTTYILLLETVVGVLLGISTETNIFFTAMGAVLVLASIIIINLS